MITYYQNGKRYCVKHNEQMQHGLKAGFKLKIYNSCYHINKWGYVSHCPRCLDELKAEIFGGDLFNGETL